MSIAKRLFLIGLLSAVTMSGCWDRKEINDVSFVLASGFDYGEDGIIEATAQVAIPSGLHTAGTGKGGGAEEPVMVLHEKDETVERVKAKLQAQLSRRLNTSHRGVIIVGEKMAEHGLDDLLDEVSRSPMNRLRSYIVVAKGSTAAEMMKVRVPIEAYPSEAIREMEKMELGTVSVTLRDFFIASTQPGQQPIATAFTVGGKAKNEKSKTFRADSIAMFKELKLVGYLEQEEMTGYDAMRGKLTGTPIEVTIPEGGEHPIAITVKHSKRKVEVAVKQGKPVVSYKINFDATVTENTSKLDLMNPKYIEKLDEVTAKKVEACVNMAVKKMQKHNSDAIGIGTEIYRKNPDLWDQIQKDWDSKMFPEVQVQVDVEANIRQVGMMGSQLQLPESEVKK